MAINPGKLKDRIEILERQKVKNAGGQIKFEYVKIDEGRANFRSVPSKEILAGNIAVNTRSGTALTYYYAQADETQFIRINEKDIYKVIGFNHSDNEESTLWTLEYLKKPEDE